jgi:hypothetical protein
MRLAAQEYDDGWMWLLLYDAAAQRFISRIVDYYRPDLSAHDGLAYRAMRNGAMDDPTPNAWLWSVVPWAASKLFSEPQTSVVFLVHVRFPIADYDGVLEAFSES